MVGTHVHHNPPRHQGGRNVPEHLYVYHNTLHSAVHDDEFILWAREGGKRGGKVSGPASGRKNGPESGRKNGPENSKVLLPYCSENGKKNGPKNVGAMNAHPNTAVNRLETVKTMNAHPNTAVNRLETIKAMNAHPNTAAVRVENGRGSGRRTGASNGKKSGKFVLLTKTETGETFVFPSISEAARVMSLSSSELSAVARGKARQHKGYIADFLEGNGQ
jgi:hypothetical protein